MRGALLCTALFLLAAPVSEAQHTPEMLSEPVAVVHEAGMTTAVEPMHSNQVMIDTDLHVEATETTPEAASEMGAQVTARNMFTIIGVVVVVVALISLLT